MQYIRQPLFCPPVSYNFTATVAKPAFAAMGLQLNFATFVAFIHMETQ
jgi:hypothetical protein